MSPVERRTAGFSGAIWGLVYLLVSVTGQRFSTAYLGYGWQLVPYEVLRAHPIRSVWYLHIQPPLWNLMIGLTGRWSPFADGISFQLIQAVFGIVAAALLAVALLRLRCRPWLALGFALAGTLNPEYLRNAFEPTYELAVGCLLIAAVFAITSFAADRSLRSLLAVSTFVTAVVLTRSLYHPVWALAILGLVIWPLRTSIPWKHIGVAFAVPVLLCGGWMLKNEMLFGRATLSSWFGMNLQRAVIPVLPLPELQLLHDEGKVSDVAMIGPFGKYDLYRAVMPPCTPEHSDPALTVEARDVGGVVVPNLNYECFLPVYDRAGADARAVISAYPRVFVDGRAWSARTWFGVNQLADETESWPLRQLGNVFQIIRLDVPGNLSTAGWGTPIYGDLTVGTHFSLTALNLSLLVFGAGVLNSGRLLRRRITGDLLQPLVVGAAGMTALWTFVVGVTGELGEQARFRTMTDPLVFAIGGFVVLRWLAARFGWSTRSFVAPAEADDQPQDSESAAR